MKRVSCKVFLSVLWRGICQVLGWFFGLFCYKRDGKFARCVWGLFALSSTIVMCFIAFEASYTIWKYASREYRYIQYQERRGGKYVSNFIGLVKGNGSDGYLINKETREKVLTGIEWIAKPMGKDTLVCYSDGKLRGYFSRNTGEVIVKPRFKHAWVFSDGMASVVYDGKIKFIDCTGKIIIDTDIKYDGSKEGYIFRGGYCVIPNADRGVAGLMDKTGRMVLPLEYDRIESRYDCAYWTATKNDTVTVYDKDMNRILVTEGEVYLYDTTIDVILPDHTMRKYDYDGNLIHDFYICSVGSLTYATDDIYYSEERYVGDDGETHVSVSENRKQAVARLRIYSVGNYVGLMTAEGHIITKPLYQDIDAIGYDTYICTESNYDKVIVNGKGEIVR